MKLFLALIFVAIVCCHCSNDNKKGDVQSSSQHLAKVNDTSVKKLNPKDVKTVHVFVALCDNKYQGIVPVGKIIGNGQDADNNLYWGCDYGVRTYFKKKSSQWVLIETRTNISTQILERIVFKHKTENVYLLADAYDGQFIKQTTIDFLQAAAGEKEVQKIYKGDTIYFGGASDILSYIGHDGLMDFSLPVSQTKKDSSKRETIILACYSKKYFSPHIKQTGATPLLWTMGLMAPEAYTLHDALQAWIEGKPRQQVQQAAAMAYAKYQHCSIRAAGNLLVSGW